MTWSGEKKLIPSINSGEKKPAETVRSSCWLVVGELSVMLTPDRILLFLFSTVNMDFWSHVINDY